MKPYVCYKAKFPPRGKERGYDRLMPPAVRCPDTRYVLFMDVPEPGEAEGWEILPAPLGGETPVRRARHHKCLAHVLFPEAEATFWLDGTMQPTVKIGDLVRRYLRTHDMAAHAHPARDCLYAEARKVASNGKADPAHTTTQVAEYARLGFPRRFGLHATGALLRRNTPALEAFNLHWWTQICVGTHRDQVSFDFCRWVNRIKTTQLRGSVYSSPYFRFKRHWQ